MKTIKGLIVIGLAFLLLTSFACTKTVKPGELVWKVKTPSMYTVNNLIADKKKLYIVTNTLLVLDKFSGKRKWSYSGKIDNVFLDDSSVVIQDGGRIYLLNKETGELRRRLVENKGVIDIEGWIGKNNSKHKLKRGKDNSYIAGYIDKLKSKQKQKLNRVYPLEAVSSAVKHSRYLDQRGITYQVYKYPGASETEIDIYNTKTGKRTEYKLSTESVGVGGSIQAIEPQIFVTVSDRILYFTVEDFRAQDDEFGGDTVSSTTAIYVYAMKL